MLITFEREKLYEEVWTTKMRDLAKVYGITEITLRKYCRKLNVPFPQTGYWNKVNKGNNPKKIKLPEFNGKTKIIIERWQNTSKALYKDDDKLKNYSEKEKSKIIEFCENIEIPGHLYKPHKLIKETMFYEGVGLRDYKLMGKAKNLNLKASRNLRDRAIRIFDTVFKSVEKLGFQVESNGSETKVLVDKEDIKIMLKEKLTRVKCEKNESNNFSYYSYEYKFSGELVLSIEEDCAPRKQWRDNKQNKLEEILGEFIIAIIDTAAIIKENRKLAELASERRRKREREEFNLKKHKEFESDKFEQLKEYAENYRISKLINEYIDELEKNMIAITDSEKKMMITNYINWARNKADYYNPFIQKNDVLLGSKYSDKQYDLEYKDYWS